MDNPIRANRFLRRVNNSLDQLLIEEKEIKPKVAKPTSTFLSQEQIDEHYDEHYKGYLKGLVDARTRLADASQDEAHHNGSIFRSALFDVAFNYNGVVLHELYFECLGTQNMSKKLEQELTKSFGSKDKMMSMLKATLLSSKGWALMGYDKRDDQICISLIDSHDCSVPYWCPLLALDVWEHAYYIDYKSDKGKYVDALLEDINWNVVEQKLEEAKNV